MNRCPPLVKDIYYDSENVSLPYTEAAAAYKKKTYRGSVANMTFVSQIYFDEIFISSQELKLLNFARINFNWKVVSKDFAIFEGDTVS